MCGSFSRSAASRIHIAVCASTGPSERYSAMPSTNHSGNARMSGRLRQSLARIGARHVELKRVHELVSEHVIGVGERAGHRQHDAPLQRLGDAARAFADEALDGVGLPEVRGRRRRG